MFSSTSRRRLTGLTLIILCLGLIVPATVRAAKRERPNFVFILADDLGYGDLSCYGAPDIRTPNLDRLATQGVRMTRFYANGPVCTPTRAALMTGRYQQRIGGLEWAIPPASRHLGLPPGEKTLAQMLRDAGYATALSGKWHLGYTDDRAPNHHGFDRFFGLLSGNHHYFTHRENTGDPDLYLDTKAVEMDGYSTHLITQRALEFLSAMKAQPFFLYLAFNAPHWPIQGPDDGEIEITRTNWTKGTRETYVKMVQSMDEGIGRILEALDREGLTDNTLVVFTSDNGGDRLSRNAPLSRHKGTLWEGGLRAPCIVRWPGKLPAGVTSDQVGITMDWTASLAKLAGAKPPKNRSFDGFDLLPILSGKRNEHARTLFWRRVDPKFVKTHRAVLQGDWKYIEETGGEAYLYDLANDVAESNNLVADQQRKAARLKKLLDRWEDEMDPPLYPVPVATTETGASK